MSHYSQNKAQPLWRDSKVLPDPAPTCLSASFQTQLAATNSSYTGLLYVLWKYHLLSWHWACTCTCFISTYNDQGMVLWTLAHVHLSGLSSGATSSERPSLMPHSEVTSSRNSLMPSCLYLSYCSSKPQVTFYFSTFFNWPSLSL